MQLRLEALGVRLGIMNSNLHQPGAPGKRQQATDFGAGELQFAGDGVGRKALVIVEPGYLHSERGLIIGHAV